MSDCCAPQGQDRGWALAPHLRPSQGPQHGGVALCPTPAPGATTARPSHEALRLGVTAWDGAIPPHPSPARAGPGRRPLGAQGQFSQPVDGAVCQQPLLR